LDSSLSKNFRLRSKEDFSYLRDNSRRKIDSFLRVYYKKSRIGDVSRVGFSISKKVGKANIRNRTKRILKEIFRHSFDLKTLGYDMLLIVDQNLYKKFTEPKLAESDILNSFRNIIKQITNEKSK